jgi:hypothetical protein
MPQLAAHLPYRVVVSTCWRFLITLSGQHRLPVTSSSCAFHQRSAQVVQANKADIGNHVSHAGCEHGDGAVPAVVPHRVHQGAAEAQRPHSAVGHPGLHPAAAPLQVLMTLLLTMYKQRDRQPWSWFTVVQLLPSNPTFAVQQHRILRAGEASSSRSRRSIQTMDCSTSSGISSSSGRCCSSDAGSGRSLCATTVASHGSICAFHRHIGS